MHVKIKPHLKLSGFIIPILVALFNVLILLYPGEIIGASKEGLNLWFNNVLPSLVPFIIGTNILAGLGIINFLGVLLSPLMYPLFGVSGAGSFALIAGMTSGCPMGAKITASLRENNDISQIEAQRLCSFVNNSGPLFILGTVGVGMFKSAGIGYFIMTVHYSAALITGFFFKYYHYSRDFKALPADRLLECAVRSMNEGRRKDGRSFGRILGDSVKNTMETVVQIGGFIILFCVIVKIMEVTDLTGLIQSVAAPVLNRLKISGGVLNGIVVGMLEMTNGSKLLAEDSAFGAQAPAIAAVCGVVSFGGFSIHAQSAAFLSKTDIKTSVYILSKLLNGVIAVIIAWFLLPFFNIEKDAETAYASAMYGGAFVDKLVYSSIWFLLSIVFVLAGVVIYSMLRTTTPTADALRREKHPGGGLRPRR